MTESKRQRGSGRAGENAPDRLPSGAASADIVDRGRLYKRCGCRAEDGRQLGFGCPRLDGERSHGRWYFAVQTDDLDGGRTRVRKGGFASRDEAERALAEFLRLPSVEAVARMWTVGRFLRFWLAELESRQAVRPSTLVSYRRIVELHLVPQLGRLRLSKLRTKQVQRALDRIAAQRTGSARLLAASTVHGIRAVLRSALSDARRRGLVGFNPAWRLRTPAGVRAYGVVWSPAREDAWRKTGLKPRVACWDLPHLASFVEAVQDDRLFALWWLVGLRGPRRGELAALRWQDLDFVGRELTIREQVLIIDGVEHIGPPKSMAGVRTLALDETTIAVFWQHWRAETARRGGRRPDPDDAMFTYPDGRPLRPDWITREFQRLCANLDLPPVRLRDLRHGAVSLAGAAGVALKVLQHDAGHASAVTTADSYYHVFAETAHAAVADTAALLLSHAKIRMSLAGASQA